MENVRKYYSKVKELLSQDDITNEMVNIETTKYEHESLDGIRNKLLTLPKDNIIHYARFIAETVNEEIDLFDYYLNEDLDFDFLHNTLDLDYLYQHDYTRHYQSCIASLFERFGVNMYIADLYEDIPFNNANLDFPPDETTPNIPFDEASHEIPLDETGFDGAVSESKVWWERNPYILDIKDMAVERPKPINARDRKEIATVAQKWSIIRGLMECAVDWRLTDDENRLNYNKTDISRLIAFLCGGSEEFIRKHLEDEVSVKDVNAIFPYLQSVGLHKIAERINQDLR